MFEPRVFAGRDRRQDIALQRGHPIRVGGIQAEWQVNKGLLVSLRCNRATGEVCQVLSLKLYALGAGSQTQALTEFAQSRLIFIRQSISQPKPQ